MATDGEITTAATAAETLALTPAQMVALLDRLIAEAIVDHKMTVTYAVNGRSRTLALDAARSLREMYAKEARIAVGMVVSPAEFVGE